MGGKFCLTRQEIENRLERGLVGKIVTYEKPNCTLVTGKLHRLGIEVFGKELMVSFIIGHERYQCDLYYFADYLIIHNNVDTQGTNPRSVRWVLQGNR